MEPPKTDVPKLPDMVMCGDHPSFTKTELNAKEGKPEQGKKHKLLMPYAGISPSSSRTDRVGAGVVTLAGVGGGGLGGSEHALRLLEARRRVRSLEAVQRADVDAAAPGNRALVQAALGSFRWPPYLLAVWVAVLVATHVLHCLVTVLERSLPNIKKFCTYFRAWAEESWRADVSVGRALPVALAIITGLLYALYFGLYVLYSVALWSIEPLCSDLEETRSTVDVMEPKVTNYIDEVGSKTNTTVKH